MPQSPAQPLPTFATFEQKVAAIRRGQVDGLRVSQRQNIAANRREHHADICDEIQSRLNSNTNLARREELNSDLADAKQEETFWAAQELQAGEELRAQGDESRPGEETIPGENSELPILRRLNDDLRAQNQGLSDQLSQLQRSSTQEVSELRTRIANLENGAEVAALIRECGDLRAANETAQRNLTLFEGAMGMRGVSPEAVIAAGSKVLGNERSELVSELKNCNDPRRRGEIAAQLRKLDNAAYKKE